MWCSGILALYCGIACVEALALQCRWFKFCVERDTHYVCLEDRLPVLKLSHCWCCRLFSLFSYFDFTQLYFILGTILLPFFQYFWFLFSCIFKYFIIIVLLFITFLQALVHWCACESFFVLSVISSAGVSNWIVTDCLFVAGWRLFNHLLLSASESGAFHCSLFFSPFYITVVRINFI